MSDIELLKKAADAIGLQYEWHHGCGDALHLTGPDAPAIYWNPLESSADALELAMKMMMDISISWRSATAVRPGGGVCRELRKGLPMEATRRAIVRAAVE